jgi:chromosome segregation ATPase
VTGWGEVLAEALAAVLIFGGAWVTARYTMRGAATAAAITAQVQKEDNEATREDRFIQRLNERLDAVEADARECREENTELREAHTILERKVYDLRRELEEERRKREHDSRALARAQEQLELLRQYAGTLRTHIEQRGHTVPPPPPGLVLDE